MEVNLIPIYIFFKKKIEIFYLLYINELSSSINNPCSIFCINYEQWAHTLIQISKEDQKESLVVFEIEYIYFLYKITNHI